MVPQRVSGAREVQDVLSEFRPIKIHWTKTLRDQRALTIRDECSGCTTQPVLREYLRFRVKRDRHRVMVLGKEWLHVLCAAFVNGNSEDPNLLLLKICEGPLHGGHLCLTDHSPCSPKSQEHDITQ